MAARRPTPVAGIMPPIDLPPGSVTLVTGGIGAGRSRAARDLAAGVPEHRVLAVRPVRALPRWTVRELLRLLAELGGAGAGATEYPRTARGLGDLLRDHPRIADGLLVVDDAHLCDPAGAELLAALLAAPAAQRPRIVLTARGGWSYDDLHPRLTAWLSALSTHELPPLDRAASDELAAKLLGAPPAAELGAALFAATDGNPSALRGVLTDAVDSDAVMVFDDRAHLLPRHRLALPEDHPLPHRVAELPEPAVRVAELIAVLGPRPKAELARDSELSAADTERAIAVLRAAGVLAGPDDRPRRAVPVLWDALCARSAPWRRAAAQARLLAARHAEGTATRLHALAADAARWGHTLRPAELDVLLAGPDEPPAPDTVDALAAELLPFAGLVPPAEVVEPAVRHWARTGEWARIAALPEKAITVPAVRDRVRATLLVSGPSAAMSVVDGLLAGPDEALRAELRSLIELEGADPNPAEPTLPVADDAALLALRHGRWDEVLALAVSDRLRGASAHPLTTADEPAAYAAEVWVQRGRPEFARQWLADSPSGPDKPAVRPAIEYARAGLDLVFGRPDAALARLDEALAAMARIPTDRHRDLLLQRRVVALAMAGRGREAQAAFDELRRGTEDPVIWLRALAGLAEKTPPAGETTGTTGAEDTKDSADIGVDLAALTRYQELAEAGGLPLDLALARLALGIQTRDGGLVRQAATGFAALRAGLWEVRTAAVAQRLETPLTPFGKLAAVDELVGDLVAAGLSNAEIGLVLHRNETYVKRQVSRLLRATNSRHRAQLIARPRQARSPRHQRPADPVRWLAECTDPVVPLVGPPGSGRTSTLDRLRRELSTRDGSGTVLPLDGRQLRRDPSGLAGALLRQAGGQDAPADPVAAAEAVLDALATTGQVLLLVDNADTLDTEDIALARVLAAAAGGGLRLVLATVRPWPELAEVSAPPLRLATPPGARPTPSVRGLTGRTPEERRAVALIAALGTCRLPAVEPALAAIGLPVAAVRTVVWRLLSVGLLDQTASGALRWCPAALGESLAAAADPADLRGLHRAVTKAMLAVLAEGRGVARHVLADHIAGAGAEAGQTELVEAAEHTLATDPARAQRWCAALLAAEPADPELTGRAAAVSAHAAYDLAQYTEAARLARIALDARPHDALTTRTVLISSLIRLGEHDTALDLAADPPGESRSVPDALQRARILLLTERFDDALRALAAVRPTQQRQRVAVLAGVRVLAAIGAEGKAWLAAERHAGQLSLPMSATQFDSARQALAWGDLFSAELAIMPVPPAARWQPPPSLSRLASAVTALREGDWGTVVELEAEHVASAQEHNYVDGLLAALAAEALSRQGLVAKAAALMAGRTTEQPFGHVLAWAAAGVDLAAGEVDRALRGLAEADRRCQDLGYLAGRELVLSREVDAHLLAGDHDGARAACHRLRPLAARVRSRQATLYWLISQLAVEPAEHTAVSALRLAERFGDRLLVARARLGQGRLGDTEALRAAHAELRELGVVHWQREAAELLRTQGVTRRAPEKLNDADRKLIELIAGGATNQEAAGALRVTEKAIEARLTRIYRRTGLRSRVDLVREYDGGERAPA
ncbi:MAG TPA: AAA family ATPase [Amycolatopsis sp.]|nr:AAA family ATPase [Amycolatopsis sp.]